MLYHDPSKEGSCAAKASTKFTFADHAGASVLKFICS